MECKYIVSSPISFCSRIRDYFFIRPPSISMGSGKMMVEFLSAAIELSVCRYRICMAAGDWLMMSAASFREREAFISPSAKITLALASLFASASAAMALCI